MPVSAAVPSRHEPDRDEQNPTLFEECAGFTGDAIAPVAVGTAVAETVQGWGIVRQTEQVRRIAVIQTAWLLAGACADGVINLRLRLDVDRHELTIALGAGSTPHSAAPLDPQLQPLLRDCLSVVARADGGGRELVCVLKIRPEWRVRLDWQVDSLEGLSHPNSSYEPVETRQRALALARCYLRGIGSGAQGSALLSVHIQGPEQGEDDWELVGALHPAADDLAPPTPSTQPASTRGRHPGDRARPSLSAPQAAAAPTDSLMEGS